MSGHSDHKETEKSTRTKTLSNSYYAQKAQAERPEQRFLSRLEDFGFSDLKKQILLAAGLTPEIMGGLLRQSVEAFQAGMSAEKTQYFTHAGQVIDQRTDIDHSTRIKSAAEAAHLVSVMGELKPKEVASHTGGSGVSITLNVPFLEQLRDTTVDVTPADPETI